MAFRNRWGKFNSYFSYYWHSITHSTYYSTGIIRLKVDISSGQVTRESIPNGKPAAPVQLEGCTYALWAESGYYVRDCGGDDYERAQHPELAAAKQPVFRANRKVIVINDEVTGDVFLPLKQMVKVNNWEQVES